MTIQTSAVLGGYRVARSLSGVSGTYARGAHSVTLVTIPAMTQLSADSGDGVIDIVNTHDFLILCSELILNGAVTLPLRGDTYTTGGVEYTVLSNAGDAQYRYTDQERVIIRVHMKQVS